MTKLANVIPVYECNAADYLASTAPGDCLGAKPDWTIERFALEGLKQWRKVVDSALIATAPQHIPNLYLRLREILGTDFSILGGTKSSYYTMTGEEFNPFDVDGWNNLADDSNLIYEATDQWSIWVDNETWLSEQEKQQLRLNIDDLGESLTDLSLTQFEAWFAVPNILREPHLREKSARLVRAFADHVPCAKFVTTYTGFGPEGLWDDRAEAQRLMWELVGKLRCIPMAYVRMDGHWPDSADTPRMRVWTPQEFLTALSNDLFTLTCDERGQRDNPVLVYCGGDFMRCAREFRRLLS